MAYTLQALIGKATDVSADIPDNLVKVPLPQGFVLIPLKQDIPILGFGDSEISSGILFLVKFFNGSVAYIEAEFFGGAGGQSTAVWRDGKLIFGPERNEAAINSAMILLGVEKGDSFDEFEALDLGLNRDTELWR